MARITIDLGLLLFIGLASIFSKGSSTSCSAVKTVAPRDGPPDRSMGKPSALEPPYEGSKAQTRSKRCTCYSYKDKECVYYCHLDIIWINTPERIVPYGMSSYRGPQRIMRSAEDLASDPNGAGSQRCVCASPVGDPQCSDFCQASLQLSIPNRAIPRGH